MIIGDYEESRRNVLRPTTASRRLASPIADEKTDSRRPKLQTQEQYYEENRQNFRFQNISSTGTNSIEQQSLLVEQGLHFCHTRYVSLNVKLLTLNKGDLDYTSTCSSNPSNYHNRV